MVVFRSPVMVGRDVELDRLLRVVADADHGQPRFVVIEGEAGIGKTTRGRAGRATRPSVRDGSGPSRARLALPTGELPFGLLSEVVRDLTHRLGTDRVADLLGSEAETLAALVPSLGDVERPSGPVDRAAVFGARACCGGWRLTGWSFSGSTTCSGPTVRRWTSWSTSVGSPPTSDW